MLVIVIAITIGIDDAFILIFQYTKAKKELALLNTKYLNIGLEYLMPKNYEYSNNFYNFIKTTDLKNLKVIFFN